MSKMIPERPAETDEVIYMKLPLFQYYQKLPPSSNANQVLFANCVSSVWNNNRSYITGTYELKPGLLKHGFATLQQTRRVLKFSGKE